MQTAIRLYPSVPINTRTVRQTSVLPRGGGPEGLLPVLVRKGENVAFCVYVMHGCKDLYGEDAEVFRTD